MTKRTKQPPTQIRIRPEARQAIDRVSGRYRLTITETVSVLVDAFESLSADEQLRIISATPNSEIRNPKSTTPTPEASAA